MASIDEIVTSLQGVKDKLDDVAGAVNTASSEADEAINAAMALSARGLVEALQIVKDTIEKIGTAVSGTVDLTDEAITQAQAAEG